MDCSSGLGLADAIFKSLYRQEVSAYMTEFKIGVSLAIKAVLPTAVGPSKTPIFLIIILLRFYN